MHNPQSWPNASTNGVKTGRPSSAARMNSNVVDAICHVNHRRLGLYTVQPNKTQSDYAQNWSESALAGSMYRTHGYVLAGDSYSDISGDWIQYYAGFCKQESRNDTTYHLANTFSYPTLSRPRFSNRIAVEMSQSFCSNLSTTPDAQTINTEVTSSIFTVPYSSEINNDYYDSHDMQSYFSDLGPMQFTTRDLKSYRAYERVGEYATTYLGDSTTVTADEGDYVAARGSIQANPNVLQTLYNVTYYVPTFTAYPAGGV